MNNFTQFFTIVAMLVIASPVAAQEAEVDTQPGFFVMSENMVDYEDVQQYDAKMDSVFVPVLNGLVEEDLLLGWGLLNHAWGNEWNRNIYYVTESHQAFLDFWEEFESRINEQNPDFWIELSPLLEAHRDNMYTIGAMGGEF